MQGSVLTVYARCGCISGSTVSEEHIAGVLYRSILLPESRTKTQRLQGNQKVVIIRLLFFLVVVVIHMEFRFSIEGEVVKKAFFQQSDGSQKTKMTTRGVGKASTALPVFARFFGAKPRIASESENPNNRIPRPRRSRPHLRGERCTESDKKRAAQTKASTGGG